MEIKTLYLKNFRNYEEALVNFSPGINFIQGNNAQGKTSLLEAISILSTGRSFRTEKISELIKDGAPFFHLETLFEKEGIHHRLKVVFDGTSKAITYNEKTYSNFSSILGLLPSVISAPTDVDLILGAPDLRRRHLNLHIAQSDPLYVYHLSRFNRALKQRNALLKIKELATIEIWESEMAQSSEYITLKRKEALSELSHLSQNLMKSLSSQNEKIALKYTPSCQSKEEYIAQMKKHRPREVQYGYTLFGPHRDDFEILQNDKLAKVYASEGQKQSIIAALRFSEKERLSALHGSEPLFGMDDFTNHLDHQRQQLLKAQLMDKTQTFLTTPLLEPQGEAHFFIEKGSIKQSVAV
jgi:DNA replication and repair protein RecF